MAIPISSSPNFKPVKPTKLKAKQALTAKQKLAVGMVAEGKTEITIAHELKVSERTVTYWKANPAFKALLEQTLANHFIDEKPILAQLRRDALMGIQKLIQHGSFKAMEHVLKMTEAEKPIQIEENITVQFGPPLDADAIARMNAQADDADKSTGDGEAAGNNNPSS
jgi:hypothetical protein